MGAEPGEFLVGREEAAARFLMFRVVLGEFKR